MERPRAGILDAAADLVAGGGPRALTMSAVARRAAVAKATVYNHFRDREELLLALLAAERARLVAHCSMAPQADRLDGAATWLSESAVLAGLRQHDPGTLVRLAEAAASDDAVRDDVQRWCADGADPARAMRWLLSFAVAPARSTETSSAPERAHPVRHHQAQRYPAP
jgi:AcrR family transcriptional regulator